MLYPEHPKSAADLLPLPLCDSLKLKAFDFKGPQKIEFLEFLGEGLHSYVLKVRILGEIYVLKLFLFPWEFDFYGAYGIMSEPDDLEVLSAFIDYSDPFCCECRAYGRIQEAGCEDTALKCFGYVLIDDDHERAVMDQFDHIRCRGFSGSTENYIHIDDPLNTGNKFRSKDGRLPPIRGIIMQFGQAQTVLRNEDAREYLKDITRLQKIGIISLDVGIWQLINGKHADFSTAITMPHFLTNPELNPYIPAEWFRAMEVETFQICLADYSFFEVIVKDWNEEHPDQKVRVFEFPEEGKYVYLKKLRNTPARQRLYTLIDVRKSYWKHPGAGKAKGGKAKGGEATGTASEWPRRVDFDRPLRWECRVEDPTKRETLRLGTCRTKLTWEFRGGRLFPRTLKWQLRTQKVYSPSITYPASTGSLG